MPRFQPKIGGPRKSNASTPAPGESDVTLATIADRLSYADSPRPFRNPNFSSKLYLRTASAPSQTKKNVKQLLVLERERVSGGDGFLTAAQCAAKARGEVLEIGSKKKKAVGPPKPKGWNLKNRGGGMGVGGRSVSGFSTPLVVDSPGGSGGTPAEEEEEEDNEGDDAMQGGQGQESILPRKEVVTYHTPTAPPSLLPAKKYCDITGLHAGYTDPRTKLRYKGLDVWHVVRGLGPGGDQAYLALRGAQTSLK